MTRIMPTPNHNKGSKIYSNQSMFLREFSTITLNKKLPLFFSYKDENHEKYLAWSSHLHGLLSKDSFIAGEKTLAEDFIVSCLENVEKELIQNWLEKFYYDHMDSSVMKLGLLHAISHIKYELLYPCGQSIALVGLTDPDDEVIEFSIKAFENWEDSSSISLLKGRKIKNEWLQKYLEEVIKYLEEL